MRRRRCGDVERIGAEREPDQRGGCRGRTWQVVVLGDSGASGSGDPTGLAWGARYGQLLRHELGLDVVVANLAVEGKSHGESSHHGVTRGRVAERSDSPATATSRIGS